MSQQLTIGDLVYQLGFKDEQEFIQRLDQVMQRGDQEAKKGGSQAGKSWTDQFKAVFSGAALGSFVGGIFSQMFMRASAQVQQFFNESIQAATGFEARLSNIATLGANSTEQMALLRDGVLQLAPALGEGPQALSEALYDIVSAGFAGDEALQVLEASARGARAGLTDTKTAADAVTTALNAYGLRASESTRITDALQTTVALGKTTWDELGSSIGMVIPIAASAGVPIEELGAALAATTGQGIATAQSVTGLRSTLTAILNPSSQARAMAQQLGIEFNAQALRAKGLAGVLEDVRRATGGNEEQMAILLGRVEALNTVLALTSENGAERFRAGQEGMREAAGATDAAFEQQMSTTAAAEARFQAAMETIRISVGEQFLPAITDAKNLFTDFVLGFMQQSGDMADTANEDMYTAGLAFRGFADDVWDALGDVVVAIGGVMREIRLLRERTREFFEDGNMWLRDWIENWNAVARYMPMMQTINVPGMPSRQSGAAAPGVMVPDPDNPGYFKIVPADSPEALAYQPDGSGALPNRTTPPPRDPPPGGSGGGSGGGSSGSSRQSTARQVDPLIDEASRVRAHFDYLKSLRELDRLGLQDYESYLQAHLRRLGGMFERAESQDQRMAILRTEQQIVRELEQLSKERAANEARARQQYQEARQRQLDKELEQERRKTNLETSLASGAARERQRIRDREAAETIRADTEAAQRAANRADLETQLAQNVADEQQRLRDREEAAAIAADTEAAQRTQRRAEAERQMAENIETAEQARENAAQAAAIAADTEIAQRQAAVAAAREQMAINAELQRQAEAIKADTLEAVAAAEAQREAEQRRIEQAEAARDRIVSSNEAAQATTSDYVTVVERAQGEVVRLTMAQYQLGQASREDVVAALRDQIAMIERIIQAVPLGTKRYFELAAAIEAAKRQLEDLTKSDFDIEVKGLEDDLTRIFLSLPRALVEGIKDGDLGGALMGVLGNAADFFIDRMIQGVLGPIAEELAATVTKSLMSQTAGGAAGINPLGIALGIGGLLVSGILAAVQGNRQRREQNEREVAQRSRPGSASVTINATVNQQNTFEAGLGSPEVVARFRALARDTVIDLLEQTPLAELARRRE